MTTIKADPQLTDDDRMWLARCTIGRKPIMEWLATDPPADTVRAMLVKFLDRSSPGFVVCRVLAAHLGVDPVRVYAENWPRKAAKLAEKARARGDHPHAEALHTGILRQDEVMGRAREHGRTEEDDVVVTFKAYVSVPGGAYTVTRKACLTAQDPGAGTPVDTLPDDEVAAAWQQETLWPAA